ncbi:ABC transporter permease [Paenibacillus sp. CN-4]|uniref:ABC transporter permease n=1 Tax=Paenibacillus nanchangensis TaxID=3348343 RepID=UPI00397D5261
MKANLIRQEWRQNAKGFWIGLTSLAVLIGLLLGKADAFVGNPEIVKLIESLPPLMTEAFGLTANSFATYEGYAASQVFPYYTLLLSCFAAAWASGTIVKEKERGSGELLFSLPYRRSDIFLSKAAAHLVMTTLLFLVCSAIVIVLGLTTMGLESPVRTGLMLLAGYLLSLAFSGIGYALTAWFGSERAAWSTSLGVVLAAFILNMVTGGEWVNRLADLSPFRLFDAADIVQGGGLTALSLVVTLGLYLAGIACGVATLKRRDFM